jgi:polyhydroxyalkanoate synthase
MTCGQIALAAGPWAGALSRRPTVLASWTARESEVLLGQSLAIPESKDRRFADPVWEEPWWRRVMQTYLVTRAAVFETVERLDLDDKSADRARFALMQITEAAAPSNNLLTNPVALRTARATQGRSLLDWSRHLLYDLRNNGGMPSQVDTRPFRIGETISR